MINPSDLPLVSLDTTMADFVTQFEKYKSY
jgi:hypothetical protein